EPPHFEAEAREVELRHSEGDVDEVLRVRLERLDNMESTARPRITHDLEEDVVPRVPVAVGEHLHAPPVEMLVDVHQEPEHHVRAEMIERLSRVLAVFALLGGTAWAGSMNGVAGSMPAYYDGTLFTISFMELSS